MRVTEKPVRTTETTRAENRKNMSTRSSKMLEKLRGAGMGKKVGGWAMDSERRGRTRG